MLIKGEPGTNLDLLFQSIWERVQSVKQCASSLDKYMGIDRNRHSVLLWDRIAIYNFSFNDLVIWKNTIKGQDLIGCNLFINNGHLTDLQAKGVV